MRPRGLPAVLAIGVLAVACQSNPPDGVLGEGSQAPPFALPSADGTTVRLDDFLGDRAVLLYFSMGPG
jgi:hypothetical protein